MRTGHTRSGITSFFGHSGISVGNPAVNWDEPVIPKRAFSLLGGRSGALTVQPSVSD